MKHLAEDGGVGWAHSTVRTLSTAINQVITKPMPVLQKGEASVEARFYFMSPNMKTKLDSLLDFQP